MTIIHRRWTLYRDPAFYASFPSVCRLDENRILVAFRRAPDDRHLMAAAGAEVPDSVDHVHSRSHIMCVTLTDEGEAVDQPTALPLYGNAADQDANLHVTASGRVLQYGFLWRPVPMSLAEAVRPLGQWSIKSFNFDDGSAFLPWGGYVRQSDDQGGTWSPHRLLPQPHWPVSFQGLPGQGARVFPRGRIAEQADGTLWLPVYVDGPEGIAGDCVGLYRSTDDGATWQADPGFAAPDGCHGLPEPSLFFADRTMWAACRTRGADDRIALARTDSTGGAVHLTSVRGHPCDVCSLTDQRLLFTFGYRHSPFGVRARIVSRTDELDAAPDHILADDFPGADCGYPWSVALERERVLTVFYGADGTGVRGIEAVIWSPGL